ncbi:ABC transporter ATP-binding protein [Aliishimia ponticola]|uniref:ABC transporter ATP-binding protein n=1 Tax=Aliishimia ponticola TaxID=2499833 RepID=A0A4S4NK16_9RHOB|nr:ABC transporter ATP-binding protein [Aliishimia ponticola]THH39107.1 ABC transporter ATP-binding protein [Aliishimia ponticola]
MVEPVLDVRGLTVALPSDGDRANAVEDISLTVAPGEIVCVVGESGSGKSVTASAVMGLLPAALKPVAGEALLEGENTLAANKTRLRALRGTRMAMIFQEPMTALNPVARVGEQIAEMLEIHTGMSASERRARAIEIMQMVHLPDPEKMIDAYPHQLSGGQRQRIMIAIALVLDPALLIADEPTTALDVTTQAQILTLIKEMQERRGTGVLFITHDFGVVAEIADRVVVMQHGKIVEQGTRDEVLMRPQAPYTQMLMASVPSMTPPARTPVVGARAIDVTGLSKQYGKTGLFGDGRVVLAADDVTLHVNKGETLGIVGESGSGKSTVARCIARLIAPTAGSISLHGTEIATLPEARLRPHRRKVQIVFQDPYRSLNPRRTIGLSLIEAPVNFGIPKDQALASARSLMELVGLSADALDRYPHQFSGGQRQRICIARALAVEPDVLIADEAVSALDVSVQAQVLELLDDIRARYNLAMLFITHDLRVAAQICDRLMVMQKGVVVEHGPTGQVFRDPANEYTKLLLEAAPGRDVTFGAGRAV